MHVYVCTHAPTRMRACLCVCVRACMCRCVCVHVHDRSVAVCRRQNKDASKAKLNGRKSCLQRIKRACDWNRKAKCASTFAPASYIIVQRVSYTYACFMGRQELRGDASTWVNSKWCEMHFLYTPDLEGYLCFSRKFTKDAVTSREAFPPLNLTPKLWSHDVTSRYVTWRILLLNSAGKLWRHVKILSARLLQNFEFGVEHDCTDVIGLSHFRAPFGAAKPTFGA